MRTKTLCRERFLVIFIAPLLIVALHTAPAPGAEGPTQTPTLTPAGLVMLYPAGGGNPLQYDRIQAAIDAASQGDEIVVQPATYNENISLVGKNVVLRSADPSNPQVVASTIIDGGNKGSVVTMDSSNNASTVLSGFTIRNGNPMTNEGGGGIWGNYCIARIENNVIRDNVANRGGGLSGCDGVIRNNIIENNQARYGGGAFNRCFYATIENNIIVGNTALHYSFYNCEQCLIANCTIWGNHGGDYDFFYRCNGTDLINCIIWGNTPVPLDCARSSVRGMNVSYCCIQEWICGGDGNISLDPQFVDPEYGDFSLSPTSPCIDAGELVEGLDRDLEGKQRPFDGSPVPRGDGSDFDMGALEFVLCLGLGTPSGVEATTGTYADRVEVTWQPVTGANTYGIYRGLRERRFQGTVHVGDMESPPFVDTDTGGIGHFYWITAKAQCESLPGGGVLGYPGDGIAAFSGVVLDSQTQNALRGVHITVFRANGMPTTIQGETNAEGQFRVFGFIYGNFYLEIRADEYAAVERWPTSGVLYILPGETKDVGEISVDFSGRRIPIPNAVVRRLPAGGGEPVVYSSLAEALPETQAGDELILSGTDVLSNTVHISAPNVYLHNEGEGLVMPQADLPAGSVLIAIDESASGTRILGLDFVGTSLGVPAPKASEEPMPGIDFDYATTGIAGLMNKATGVSVESCKFEGFGSGALAGEGAVSSGRNTADDNSGLTIIECSFDYNSTGVRLHSGNLQMTNSSLTNSRFADLIVLGDGLATAQVMDCTLVSSKREPPQYRVFASGSPSDLHISGSYLASAKMSVVLFGDGVMTLSGNVAYNETSDSHDVLTLASLYKNGEAGIPTEVVIDHCDLYNHGDSDSPWIFEATRNAVMHAGEIADDEGNPIAPCHVSVFDSIISGRGDTGIVLDTVDGSKDDSESWIRTKNCVFPAEGRVALERPYADEPDVAKKLYTGDPQYSYVGEDLQETPFNAISADFHYARNSFASIWGRDKGPVGAVGPGDFPAVTISIPKGLELDLRDRSIAVPVTIDNIFGVAGVDLTIEFNGDLFEADLPYPGPAFDPRLFAGHVEKGLIQVTLVTNPVPDKFSREILFYLPLRASGADEGDRSEIEIFDAEVTDVNYDGFRITPSNGDVAFTVTVIPGDVDFSGRVDILDVVAVLRKLVGTQTFTPPQSRAADVVEPFNVIDIRDAVGIFAVVIGDKKGE